jgi:hypothetical protein
MAFVKIALALSQMQTMSITSERVGDPGKVIWALKTFILSHGESHIHCFGQLRV